jgi:hypothetical protein
MYFWKVKPLVEDLKNGQVTQRQKMYYYLANAFFVFMAIYVCGMVASTPNVFTAIEMLLGLLLTIGGVLWCYEANRQGDDAEFIDRMVCLSWPITMRLLVVIIVTYVIYAMLFLGENGAEGTTIVDVIITTIYTAYYYKWLHSCLLKVWNK